MKPIRLNSGGYRILYRPKHKEADNSGNVLFHRYKFILITNVDIGDQYVIHHRDGNRLNNMFCNFRMLLKREHDALGSTNRTKASKRLARKLYMAGFSQEQIALELKVSIPAISRYVSDLTLIKSKLRLHSFNHWRKKGFNWADSCKLSGIAVSTPHHISKRLRLGEYAVKERQRRLTWQTNISQA